MSVKPHSGKTPSLFFLLSFHELNASVGGCELKTDQLTIGTLTHAAVLQFDIVLKQERPSLTEISCGWQHILL